MPEKKKCSKNQGEIDPIEPQKASPKRTEDEMRIKIQTSGANDSS